MSVDRRQSPEPAFEASRLKGRLITFEGPEGAGKTSQATRLCGWLRRLGLEVTLTREPGGTVTGEHIRELLLSADPEAPRLAPATDALLFNAARAQLVAEVIRPALARGEVVVCTRFADSTLAYQGYGSGLPLDELAAAERLATGGLRPDLTILLDLPVDVGLSRKRPGVEWTRFEASFDLAFHERVRVGFLALAVAEPDRFALIDATVSEEAVGRAVQAAVAGWAGDRARRRAEQPGRVAG